MKIENVLKYQEMDKNLWNLEQKLSTNPYKKKMEELTTESKKKQLRMDELSKLAQQINVNYQDFCQKLESTKRALEKLVAVNLEKATVEKLDEYSSTKNKILHNLDVFGNILGNIAKKIHAICSESDSLERQLQDLEKKIQICKQKIQEENSSLKPEIEKLKSQLAVFEKDVDATLLKSYKEKRQDNIFPVFVPLEGGMRCGRCRMELPKAALSKIKEKGIITCENEHCKRYIYLK